jgi:hypothetical protein
MITAQKMILKITMNQTRMSFNNLRRTSLKGILGEMVDLMEQVKMETKLDQTQ